MITGDPNFRVTFLWPELPDYAARCLGEFRRLSEAFEVRVVATRPKVPIKGMDVSFGSEIIWLDESVQLSWNDIGVDVPDVLFVGGYSQFAFSRLEQEAKKRGSKIVLMSDNSWCGSVKQFLIEPFRHRVFYRRRFDAIFVPGAAGVKMAHAWGYADDKIYTGMYGADGGIFYSNINAAGRDKCIVFVGQLIDRKNVDILCKYFLEICDLMPDWTLLICGDGPLASTLPHHPRIEYVGFQQPAALSEMLRRARVLALLSDVEHWGLVVHEAALSGCALLLSTKVGARYDLATVKNCIVCNVRNPNDVRNSLLRFDRWGDADWREASNESLSLSQNFGPKRFSESIEKILRDLLG